ncbi:MAG TPA: c-type cytochrome [Acetobacteraceae bacterium]
MRYVSWIAAAVLLAVPATTPAWAAGDAAAGRGKAESCAACHGADGISQIPVVPSLAGQPDLFIQWQLVFYRNGRRSNEAMTPLSEPLTDEDIRDLGAFYASLPPGIPAERNPVNPGLRAAGEAAAARGRCTACHTDDYSGKQAAARLAGQQEEYLAKSLAEYRSGARPSTGIAVMTQAAAGLSDEDIGAIAHYLAMLP